MSIPLVQNNDKDSINTSIIAIKRNIERINMLLGLSNSEEIDTSEFVKKSDIVDVVEAGNMNPVTSNAVVPVDEVTLGNMQSVTSNAVADAIEPLQKQYILESGVSAPVALPANGHNWKEITLEHTYSFDNIRFMITPVSYVDCAFITVSGHWGAHGTSSQGMTQSNKLTVYTTNMYSGSQTCGFYWMILGTKDNILN